MIKKDCKYFPCHEDMNDCDMCYCFLYPCKIEETGGKFIKGKDDKNIWDCSDCNIIHKKEFLSSIKTIVLKEIICKLCSCDHDCSDCPGEGIKVGNEFLIKIYCKECKKYVYKKFKEKRGY